MTDALARYLDIESEDNLTRIVFGFLELLGSTVLTEVLELSEGELSNEFYVEFHTRIDPRAERIPDVLIADADTTVMIEAKRGPVSIRTNFGTNTTICTALETSGNSCYSLVEIGEWTVEIHQLPRVLTNNLARTTIVLVKDATKSTGVRVSISL
ncbi:hypothetical protein [Natrinema versiforme]|uniref:Uncharacterized protein n=1 Tax=Natrinema versiforme TaxID=88724 RepID=A0A4V1G0A5_9EURY|nr:hypothetical protein [Natrinema versiforme]QCS44666.1 hypothetical protein FEJ81_20380 [Natrinema versiforme]